MRPPQCYLCSFCFRSLSLRKHSPEPFMRNGVKTYSLFNWYKDDEMMKNLVYGMKQGPPRFFVQSLALEMMTSFPVTDKNQTFLVPVPSSQNDPFSHAHGLAYELRSIGLYCDILEKSEKVSQKSKSLVSRRELRILCKKDKRLRMSRQRVILVDDVVASGSTAKACKEALGACQSLELWTLFNRPLKDCSEAFQSL